MKKKWYQNKTKLGFTLIELLAVIIILAIILLIIVPMATGYMESSRKKGFTSSVYHAMNSIKEDLASNDFEKFPEGGFAASSELAGLERNPFISGTFVKKDGKLYADRVTDGRYCATGTREDLEVVLGECYLLDHTAPVINSIMAGITTSNSIQVVVDAYDNESEIVSYEYSLDNGDTFTEKETENTHTFTNLTHDTSFNVVVKVTNQNHLTSKLGAVLKTIKINMPTFTSDPTFDKWSKSKVVTIHYQDPKESNFIYEYRKDGDKWEEVATGTTFDVTFDGTGTLEARVRDGYNTVSATTLTLTTIDTVAPTCETTGGTGTSNWTNKTVTLTGNCSDTGGSGCAGNIKKDFSSTGTYSPGSVSDNAGNTATCPTNVVQIDKEPPTCNTTGNVSGWTNQTITLTGTCTDTGGSKCVKNISKDFTGNTNGQVNPGSVSDNAGNTTPCPNKLVQIDKTPPTCTSTTGGSSSWKTQATTLTGVCSDTGGSDCAGNVTKSYTSANGNYSPGTVSDNAGNVSAACPTAQLKVDTQKPPAPKYSSITIKSDNTTITSNGCVGKGGGNANVECHMYVKSKSSFKFDTKLTTGVDNGPSGIKREEYIWTHNGDRSESDYCPDWATGCGKWFIGGDYNWINYYIRYVDNAGNVGPYLKIYYHITWTG